MKDNPLIDVERSVLGSMLASVEIGKRGIKLFDEDDFKVPAHRLIFQSIRTLIAAGQPLSPATVSEFLKKKKSLALVGGSGAVCELICFGSDVAPLEYYAKRLKGTFDQ